MHKDFSLEIPQGDLAVELKILPHEKATRELRDLLSFFRDLDAKFRAESRDQAYIKLIEKLADDTGRVMQDESWKDAFIHAMLIAAGKQKPTDVTTVEQRAGEIRELESIKYYVDELIKTLRVIVVELGREIDYLRGSHDPKTQAYAAMIEEQTRLYMEFKRLFIVSVEEMKRYLAEKAMEDEYKPLMSVIIPAYYEERNIASAIMSIRRQTYPRYEIIVGENFSQTTHAESRIYTHLYEHSPQRGVSVGRNIAVSRAKGDIFVFMDADVVLNPDALQRIYEEFRKNRSIVGGTCKTQISHEFEVEGIDPQKEADKLKHRKLRAALFNMYKNFYDDVTHRLGNHVPLGLFFSTRAAFEQVERFNEDKIAGEDYAFMLALGKLGKVVRITAVCGLTSDRRMLKRGYKNVVGGWFLGGDHNTKNYVEPGVETLDPKKSIR